MASQNDDRNRAQSGSETSASAAPPSRQLVQVIPSARTANTPALIEADLYEEFELPAVLRPPQQQPQQLRERLRLVESRPAVPAPPVPAPAAPAPTPAAVIPKPEQTSPPLAATPPTPAATLPPAALVAADPAPAATVTTAPSTEAAAPPTLSATAIVKADRPSMPFMDTRMRRMADSIHRPPTPMEAPQSATPVAQQPTPHAEATTPMPPTAFDGAVSPAHVTPPSLVQPSGGQHDVHFSAHQPQSAAQAPSDMDDPFSALPVLEVGVILPGAMLPPPLPPPLPVAASVDLAAAASIATTAPSASHQPAAIDGTMMPAPAPIDGAAADLLRPMLQDWLSENLPRIVEKALRIEMTGTSAKATGDAKHGAPVEAKASEGPDNVS